MAKRQTSSEIDSMIANETIIEKEVSSEMRNSYLTYSVMTIIDRALPDIRDGLKPVQRRVLFSMYNQHIRPNGSYKKSARIVGDVIGKYHPHGDTSTYGAMANLVNDFDVRYPSVDGQGNFGSADGDGPAAMRYTEAKLNKFAMEMLKDLDNDGVEMKLNFSEDELEPDTLPAMPPYLLLNGAEGIATGYTTSIPMHNMNEVCDGIIATIKKPNITIEELLKKYIKGPDLPSYGYLINDENIMNLYTTGQATLSFKGKIITDFNEENNNKQIVITELPPGVNKPKLMEKLYNTYIINKDKKVIDLRDESEGNGIRIVLELHKTAIAEVLIEDIYNNTPVSKTKSYILRAIVDQAPALLSLKQIIDYYLDHRRYVISRRTKFSLSKLEKKLNILNGFSIVVNHLKAVATLIMDSSSRSDASQKLMVKYNLNQEQIDAILSMQLGSLTKMEQNKVLNELKELNIQIAELNDILSSAANIDKIIIEELRYLKKVYGDDRKTVVIEPEEHKQVQTTVMSSDEPMFIALTNKGLVKTMPYEIFEKMVKNKSLKEKNNIFIQGLKCNIQDTFIVILSDGNYFKCDFTTLTNDLNFLDKKQKIVSILTYSNDENNNVIVLMSKKGFVKKLLIESFKSKNLKITSAFKLENDDELIGTRIAVDNDDNIVTLATKNGIMHRFYLRGFSATSQTAKPLGCINMEEDFIIDFDITDGTKDSNYKAILFTKHESGKTGWKSLSLSEFAAKNRMAKGIKTISYSKKDIGVVTNLILVDNNFFMITSNGEIMTKKIDDIIITEKSAKPEYIDFSLSTSKLLL